MAKEQKTAWQLAEMIAGKIGVSGVSVRVREDQADGWCPTIVSAPSNELGFPRRADEIAKQIRFAFDLQGDASARASPDCAGEPAARQGRSRKNALLTKLI